ncbi:MAG: Asp-tRNA(Asn)/Glu-tRNA(Gln) amidotransferase subunit GatC [Oscillospiraceae bacterium]|nr:Asp-tRNA(Asn)/Glu-tRNA(Gln) amidotransferase subunit GatC [Oscillospiraceae bacterium]
MIIDDALITYLEELSCLALSEGEKLRIKGDLQKILDSMAMLAELDTEGVAERSHPFDNVNAFREDVVAESFDRELILKNAPLRSKNAFIAPTTVQ